MPIFVYTCEHCGTKIERPQRAKKRMPNPLCPMENCRKKMKWVRYPGSNFELKGGGWSK